MFRNSFSRNTLRLGRLSLWWYRRWFNCWFRWARCFRLFTNSRLVACGLTRYHLCSLRL